MLQKLKDSGNECWISLPSPPPNKKEKYEFKKERGKTNKRTKKK
jgi:hypothetical protein